MDVSIATIFRPSYVIDLLLFYIHRTSRIVFKNIQFMLFFFFSRLPQTIGSEIIHYLPNFNSIILVSLSLYCSFSFSFCDLFPLEVFSVLSPIPILSLPLSWACVLSLSPLSPPSLSLSSTLSSMSAVCVY